MSINSFFQNLTKPYIIAEIGANHNGDMELAKKMIDAAKDSGCHAVKFQSWTPSSLICNEEYDRNQTYNDSAKKHFGSLKEMVTKYYLRDEQHYSLKKYCDEIEIDFCSTPFSIAEVDLLNDLGVKFFKIASMDITNLKLLSYVASFGKPIILSTGMAELSEIDEAIRVIKNQGNSSIVLLHCIAIYPPKNIDINLRNIPMLRETFDCPVGFSDHSIGFSIPLASVALGSCVIEKHFTTDKNLPGWDHEISADPYEMSVICRESQIIAEALGSYKRIVSQDEIDKRNKFRRSIVINKPLKKGTRIETDDLDFKRPGIGIAPNEAKYLIGRVLDKDVTNDEMLTWEHFV